jgi:ABC-2 type transport system permease protein
MNNYSQLRAMFSITKASLKSIFRNVTSVIFAFIFPLIFIIIFGFISTGGNTIDVGVKDNSSKENPLYEQIRQIETIKLIEDLNNNELQEKLYTGKIDAIINIKKENSMSPAYTIETEINKASPKESALLRLILGNITDKANLKFMNITDLPVKYTEQIVEGRKYSAIDFILPGQLGFSILSTGVFGTAFIFLSLRETLVLKRFFATPIKRNFIVMGEGISRLIFSMITTFVIILIGYFFFSFTLVNGIITLINMLLVAALGLIVFLGFGFMISNFSKDVNTVSPLANLITIPQFLLAGTFFPIDSFPSWLQPFGRIMPLTYLNTALRKIAFEGSALSDLGTELGILAAWGTIVYIIAIKFFKWE